MKQKPQIVIIIQSTNAIGLKPSSCNFKHLTDFSIFPRNPGHEKQSRGKISKFVIIYSSKRERFLCNEWKRRRRKISESFGVRLIKNTCDFLLKQLGMF